MHLSSCFAAERKHGKYISTLEQCLITLVFSVMAALTLSKSAMSTNVVLMLHFAGRNDFRRANVPPAGQQHKDRSVLV